MFKDTSSINYEGDQVVESCCALQRWGNTVMNIYQVRFLLQKTPTLEVMKDNPGATYLGALSTYPNIVATLRDLKLLLTSLNDMVFCCGNNDAKYREEKGGTYTVQLTANAASITVLSGVCGECESPELASIVSVLLLTVYVYLFFQQVLQL